MAEENIDRRYLWFQKRPVRRESKSSHTMKLYVGVTDDRWFRFLREQSPDEVNFWRPRASTAFRALQPGEPFLFKLHSPNNVVAGGGFFVRHSVLPLSLAWEAFGRKNGADGIDTLRERIASYRKDGVRNPQVGCTILVEPFFFDEEDWIPVPRDWAPNIVSGKGYVTEEREGARLWQAVQERLHRYRWQEAVKEPADERYALNPERYGSEFITRARLGQGAFRVLVTDAYQRRCAISGERTLPVLQASHIKPFAMCGPNHPDNGMLLRSDLHILFDRGYLTVTPDYEIEVSGRIRDEFENGRDYYRYHGGSLQNLPKGNESPRRSFLEWHNENLYLG